MQDSIQNSTMEHAVISLQVSNLKQVTDLATDNFEWIGQGRDNFPLPFLVKNEGQPVELEVRLWRMGDFVRTTFYEGWNPELVMEIKADTRLSSVNIKAGR